MPNPVQIVALVIACGFLAFSVVSFVMKLIKRRKNKKGVDSPNDGEDTKE